jgi:hypothetical protein
MTKSREKTKRSETVKKQRLVYQRLRHRGYPSPGISINGIRLHTPLQQDTKGTWKISLDLKPGKYEYRFLLDGEWQNDPNCDCFVENPFGTSNCLKIVE